MSGRDGDITDDQANEHVFNYIELFYNRQRKHAALGDHSPAAFEDLYHQSALQAT